MSKSGVLLLILIWLLALALRFWGLSRFNTLVFDEVYNAKLANSYLIGEEFLNAHPPLSRYLIAMGMWIASFLPSDSVNDLTGSLRSTFSYRWLNALMGSFIPLVVGAIAYELSGRQRQAILAAILVSLDGLFLVESRYALNNIYLVLFGLLGQLLLLWGLKRPRLLIAAGVSLGSAIAVKWNGLGFLLGMFLVSLVSRKWKNLGMYLGIVPLITYVFLWIPHLIMNSRYNFGEVHHNIVNFHSSIGNTATVHPYCSSWYSWIVMWRPVAYFYETTQIATEKIIYVVYGTGNPLLWWFASGSILIVLIDALLKLTNQQKLSFTSTYLLCNYSANLLPWMLVSRCLFLYHYMSAYVFALLALASILDTLLASPHKPAKQLAKVGIILIISTFIFWLPIYLGLPLSQSQYEQRLLLPNWI
ncbi:phospholipid carrier-dependent glycosyltransferase [Gloeocapsa sp. PCC 73106]|uniref:phospholipid carrier-dependent glycosyltransferase n=1 Tax=Gloeocapsa sp. PCC 73106 TaxID=102232 RepID=UPI0002AC81D9|nr:phospholipid carrier-dependent glycosyltransferase [Gloeocapsa sp. PCC 73106]ELR97725.1 dolichyl-phosphate-mannose--protein O-mannosyl transferase [Gloeocapsa sp. PCC 73106]